MLNCWLKKTPMQLTNKTIIITGATSGIGKAVAEKLAKEKCNLILLARRSELLQLLKHELKLTDNECLILKCDVSKKEDVAKAFESIKESKLNIDAAFLNAGVGQTVTVENYNSAAAEITFGANFMGLVYCVEQLLPIFLEKKNGIIAAVSSLADNRGFSGSGFYCASKAAASVYLEGLRVELSPYNIKVITVKPGFVKTAMTDQNDFKMPLLMQPEKAAEIIVNGIKKEKRIIQFPWQMVFLTRLVGLLPSKVYESLAKLRK
jgi:short-subunit dehydrogenase